MKHLLLTFTMLLAFSVHADIEYSSLESAKATPEEIQQSRSCFQEVAEQGCGEPLDDQEHFRSCVKNVKPRLKSSCQKMMTELYGA